jgi:hypothetical protein
MSSSLFELVNEGDSERFILITGSSTEFESGHAKTSFLFWIQNIS